MINAIKYLKLDLQIIKEKNQYVYFVLIPIFACIMLKYIEFGLTGMVFITFMCVGIPFSNEKLDKLDEMYRLFPYRSSTMILGKFILINNKIFIVLEMLSFVIIGGISYLISCELYKRKEGEKNNEFYKLSKI